MAAPVPAREDLHYGREMTQTAEALTFRRGGVHPPERKDYSEGLPIEVSSPPGRVEVLMAQHIGAPANPIVKKKERVRKGQLIGEAQGFISANIHAPVSGTVTGVEPRIHSVTGRRSAAVIIENDGAEQWAEDLDEPQDVGAMSTLEMVGMVKDAGVVGLGGAAFPTHVKLSPPESSPISDVLLNGAECEPFLTCDYRLMLERTEDIVDGLRLIMTMLGNPKGHIGIEANKPKAIEAFSRTVFGDPDIAVHTLEVKYPQGAEQQLIKAVTGREVPSGGGLPSDVGCVVHNVGTALAIRDAVRLRRPLIERAVTVTGDGVERPGNFLERVGTPVSGILERQGVRESVNKLILGGPMMGIAQGTADVPLLKGTSGILLLGDAIVPPQRSCIRCGRCVEHCPLGLMPADISIACEARDWDGALKLSIMECKECGCCAYVCPAGRRIVHLVKFGKSELAKRKKP